MLDRVWRKHVPDLPEKRARTPDGHAEIVEELCIQIGANARFVCHEDPEQHEMNLTRPDVRSHRRREVQAERRGIAWFRRAKLAEHHAVETVGTALDARTARSPARAAARSSTRVPVSVTTVGSGCHARRH
jgi:hypothetical protein